MNDPHAQAANDTWAASMQKANEFFAAIGIRASEDALHTYATSQAARDTPPAPRPPTGASR